MSTFRDLVALSSKELSDLARERKLKGRGSMSQADLVLALGEGPATPEIEAVVRASSTELYARAKEAGVEGYSKLSKAGLQAALLPAPPDDDEAPAAAEAPTGPEADRVYRVYWPLTSREEGDVIGYCWPRDRPGIYTYLSNGEPTFAGAVALAFRRSETQEAVIRRMLQAPPEGVEVRDPPK